MSYFPHKKLLWLMPGVFLLACSWQSAPEPEPQPTLANLEPVLVLAPEPVIEAVDLAELQSLYQEALAVSDDPLLRLQLRDRIAGIKLQRSEQRLIDEQPSAQLFDTTIAAYQEILSEKPQGKQAAHQRYQLAKAYELNGEPLQAQAVLSDVVNMHADSDVYIEAQFRLAESDFSAGDYNGATKRYGDVLAQGPSRYYENASYMLAWSQFKRSENNAAIAQFIATLDIMVPSETHLATLPSGTRQLIDDCFRMLSILFANMAGVESLSSAVDVHGERHYSAELYASLAEHYLAQQRYRDSADTYSAFIQRYPNDDAAFRYQVAIVELFKAGGFRPELLQAKQDFVRSYSSSGDYWFYRTPAQRLLIDDYLKTYLLELASFNHSLAQSTAEQESDKKRGYYLAAIGHYTQFVNSFPYDDRTGEMLFLMAECQYDIADFEGAISSYESVAYQYRESEQAIEAGYAAIVAYDQLPAITLADDAERQAAIDARARRKIASQQRFAATYWQDPRAAQVLLSAASGAQLLGEHGLAISSAEKILNWQRDHQQTLTDTQRLAAWQLIAQSAFDTADYVYAEQAYSEALVLMPAEDERRPAITENLAASIYKQGEVAQQQQQYAQAAAHYERVILRAPASEIRRSAQYDAAVCYQALSAWGPLIAVLQDFRKRYPLDALTSTVPVQLAQAYQATQQWSLAAIEISLLSAAAVDTTQQGQLLYQSAELYEKAGDVEQAIIHYRRYAHNFAEPASVNFEAMNKLAAIYNEQDEQSKRRFWLQRIIDAERKAGAERTERMQYLAAHAMSVFADDAYWAFAKIKLTLPIKKSLKLKKSALDLVVTRYKKTSAYGIESLVTLSSYRLAEVYGQLSRDLMDSERPASLDELALEQYEILLEEQAYPFEEKAIAIHESNISNSWRGIYDEWVKQSFQALAKLLPARYRKEERYDTEGAGIY